MTPVALRPARPGDGPGCYAVFHDAVHQGAQAFYSAEERAAWAPSQQAGPEWEQRLLSQNTVVATQNRQIIGFMTLGQDGYLDFAYVAPEYMGCGVSDALYAEILNISETIKAEILSTEASHLARRFFTKKGWKTFARQSVIRNGVAITNFRMELQTCPKGHVSG